ncbi:hypothetical protein ABGY98_003953 [Salmonella enterica]|uniref:hypothetical protein n=1 Tax=Salmonella enterica TaxID=28901 RepID=UPI0012B6A1E9|nr:hypothetical protein [Salmonella enterica]EDO1590805.1 hypothetical protein [Salmonella enterica subsp. enterica serovar Adelaide]EEA3036713.1 hypothetical protein [Salmonella enterica subsp. diarizonae]EGL0767982.1 hypothetical protein [Salmonella enterica subsp. enterica]EHM1621786.1 hypothetical protein [Salmonella enterica subsp. enterica serovar Typhimurium]EIE2764224.1 hypothetical protein [Salmonella enterica subsp. diarizonae serovar 35:k:e,n,x,z15]
MDEKKLKAFATELTRGLKTEADLNQFSRMLAKLTVETEPVHEIVVRHDAVPVIVSASM